MRGNVSRGRDRGVGGADDDMSTRLADPGRGDHRCDDPAGVAGAGEKPKATWVEPRFVADVGFRDITSEGLLRQSSFKGLSKK